MPDLLGGRFGSSPCDDARIVEQDVHAPELGQGLLDDAGAINGVAMIRPDKESSSASLPDLLHDLFTQREAASRDNHIRAFFGKKKRGRLPNS
jgi:hypothetical protein